MGFATKNGKFLVKNGKFCTSCCGETGEGPILWNVYARAEEASGASCAHQITGTGEGSFRTQTATIGDALAGAERHLANAGFKTGPCEGDAWKYDEAAFQACVDDCMSGCPTGTDCDCIETCKEERRKQGDCFSTQECCGGTEVKFMSAERSDVRFVEGPPAELSFTCSANDCEGKFDNNWSVRLYVKATQVIKGVNA